MNKKDLYNKQLARLEEESILSQKDKKLKTHIENSRQKYNSTQKGIIEELHQLGYSIQYVGELSTTGKKYIDAIPILTKWLPIVTYKPLKHDILSLLSVSWAKSAFNVLIQEFKSTTDEYDKRYRWAVGNALASMASKNHYLELASIVRDRSAGHTRQMVIEALAKTKHPDAADVLLESLQNDDEVGHTLLALRRLKARVPREIIEPYLGHEFPWVRKEAKKLLELQDKLYKD
ncbi:HEAT repeat domain-containing protein [Acanthopleuribacter pedis]|uniref:HEAT repeat domain-containing protein n=1 Tax=Acanthopleuribacter pedis TaxID=442870 RepID=A0A8J7U2X1_9BACT|nr:HEAT repeat domain-containing protein [Acanthopleuribacter pedis]MBO1319022.1 HEAT repeat domain-containing protein [Acanthopleuribacter pedis]